ncbi:LysR family transcriptional regulator [Pseudomonas putida]|uniref:LysR family transcriptional regulator n=1 Tax=Pseudomonas putida TaxID=303 RepID=UPI0018E6C1B1|nr:LysR family transcriptional regulator [Pseudomonas putida]MBI6941567.1 LysR family transcriptional regulator [Pseudomonas putida]MBI6957826.1 LysR family transcriptional regulator [Pseudomonas putida]
MPNFNELAAFAAVVREGSFTRAAAQLGVTPSALSHGVRHLEKRLGLTLLHRSTRSVAPTEAGQRLYTTVAPRLDDITQELSALIEQSDEVAGTVRINAPDYAVQTLIWARLSPLLSAHPRLRLEVCSEDRFTDIVAARYDLGVRLGGDVAQDMIAARIGPDMVMAVAGSPAYLALQGVPATPRELAAHSCLGLKLPTHDNLLAWEFKAATGKTMQVLPAGKLVSNEPKTLIRAACDGHGLVWLPTSLMEEELSHGQLQVVLDEHAISYEGYHLYYAARRVSPSMKVVIDALRNP